MEGRKNKEVDRKESFTAGNERGMHKKEYTDLVVDVRRVTKVTKGGKRFQFSAFVVTGDKEGSVGVGKGKGRDVAAAVSKATARARKKMFSVAKNGETVPYEVVGKHGASKVLLRPAYYGTGMIAGGAVRLVLKAIGINHTVAKSIGTSRSGINLVKATLNALAKCRSLNQVAQLRGKKIIKVLQGAHEDVE